MKIIPLNGGKSGIALVSDVDYELVSKYTWHVDHNGHSKTIIYAAAYKKGRKRKIRMHRLIMKNMIGHKVPEGCEIDHIDTCGLNNQRENLRLASRQEQTWHSKGHIFQRKSKYKGVYHTKYKNKPWRVAIRIRGVTYQGGYHATEEEAAEKYNEMSKMLHKKFSFQNQITNE